MASEEPRDARTIDFIFENQEKPGTIQVTKLIDKLAKIQEVVYYSGRFLMNKPYVDTGRYHSDIQKHCTLLLTGLKSGSTVAQLKVTDCTNSIIEDESSVGVRTIGLIGQLVDTIEMGDHVVDAATELIPDPQYRRKISRSLFELWPHVEGAGVRLRLGEKEAVPLQPKNRERIIPLFRTYEDGRESTIQGPVVKIDLGTKKRRGTIQVWTPDGKITCEFQPDLIEQIKNNLGVIVEVKGPAEYDAYGIPTSIKDIISIEPQNELLLKEVLLDGDRTALKRPLKLVMDMDLITKVWHLDNDEFRIYVIGKDYDEAIQEFYDEFSYLVEHYTLIDDSQLSQSSIEMKRRLFEILE